MRASAAPAREVRSERANSRLVEAAEAGRPVEITGLPLDSGSLQDIQLTPMKLWADDAKILLYHGDQVEEVPRPNVRYFSGKIAGDPGSAVFITVAGDVVDGLAITGSERRFKIATGRRRDAVRARRTDPLFVTELDDAAEAVQPESRWSCETAKMNGAEGASASAPIGSWGSPSINSMVALPANVSAVGAAYSARVEIDTDFELYSAFGSVSSLTAYVTNLVGAASTIYQRDLNTTLILGNVRIRDTASDPWTKDPASHDTGDALAEFGTYYHNNYPLASNARSVAVMLSGKPWFGGVAWTGVIGNNDFFCGATGSGCGGAEWANQYGGAYAFVGTTSVVATTVANPDAVVNGTQYRLPNNNNFWMLLAFAHEVGHNVAAQHTSCYALSASEQTQYGVTRGFIDLCLSGECYVGTTSAPAELGTIMSYCHNMAGLPSRYLFGKAGEPSEKMFPVLIGGMDERTGGTEANGATAVGTITMASNLSWAPGQTASVQPCATGTSPVSRTCTYAWQITGGTINGSTTGTSISFTPTAANVTVTVTLTNTNQMTMRTSKAATATPPGCTAPSINSHPTSSSIIVGASANLSVTASNATSYQWYVGTSGVTTSPVAGGTTASINVSPASTTTYWVRVTNSCNSVNSNAATITVTPPPTVLRVTPNDFNGDGKSDLVWRENGGTISLWEMNVRAIIDGRAIAALPTTWRIVGYGDFSGDGTWEMVLRNTTDGQTAFWEIANHAISNGGAIATVPTVWALELIGDFNGDKKSDIIWRNTTTGQAAMWEMNGRVVTNGAAFVTLPMEWKFSAVGDFNNDDKDDIIVRNSNTGMVAMWEMNGRTIMNGAAIGTVPLDWQFQRAAGDFNGDGYTDLLLRHTNGNVAMWEMYGRTILNGNIFVTLPAAWEIRSAGMFDTDVYSDLFLYNTSTGQASVWQMNGRTITNGAAIASPPLNWAPQTP